ncbi:MAG: hypothetical protein IPK19_21890 [Chloroflexi bacterium]|nr:hypothetical protein [Chloroflexota bacterium]
MPDGGGVDRTPAIAQVAFGAAERSQARSHQRAETFTADLADVHLLDARDQVAAGQMQPLPDLVEALQTGDRRRKNPAEDGLKEVKRRGALQLLFPHGARNVCR